MGQLPPVTQTEANEAMLMMKWTKITDLQRFGMTEGDRSSIDVAYIAYPPELIKEADANLFHVHLSDGQ